MLVTAWHATCFFGYFQRRSMVGRVKDYVCLTSISVALNVAVRVIRFARRGAAQPTHANMPLLAKTRVLVLSDANALKG